MVTDHQRDLEGLLQRNAHEQGVLLSASSFFLLYLFISFCPGWESREAYQPDYCLWRLNLRAQSDLMAA